MSNKDRQPSGGQLSAKSRYTVVHNRPKKAQRPLQLSPSLYSLPLQRPPLSLPPQSVRAEQDFQLLAQLQCQLTMTKLSKQRENSINQLRSIVSQQKNAMSAEEFKEFMDSMNLSQEELLLCGIESTKSTTFTVPETKLLLEKLLLLQKST